MHDEALTAKAFELFPLLSKFKNFYLAGGTALALHIGHRLSVDFDLFSSLPLQPQLLRQIKTIFVKSKIEVTYKTPEQLNLIIDGIKYTFFFFEYPVIHPFVVYKNVPILKVQELASMKAFSIGKRLSYKDYVDWYFLLKENCVHLPDIIRLAKKKFGHDFNDRLFLGQLVSLGDVPTQKIDFLRGEIGRRTIQKFLEQAVRKYKI